MNCEEYVVDLLNKANKRADELEEVVETKNWEIAKLQSELDELQSIITTYGKKNVFYNTGSQEVEICVRSDFYSKLESDAFNYLIDKFPNLPLTEYGKPETEVDE